MHVIHVASGDVAAGNVKRGLKLLGERATTFGFRDPYSVGPLVDVDGTRRLRKKFWATIGSSDSEWKRGLAKERAAWRAMSSPNATVILWRGLDADGFLLSLRVAAKLKDTGAQLFEIVNRSFNSMLGEFFSAISIQQPEHLAGLRSTATEVLDVSDRAKRWAAIRDKCGVMFRELEGDAIRELPEDGYDARLLQECTREWKTVPRVIGHTMADVHIGDWILFWRLNELIKRGALVARGDGQFRTTEVRLP